MAIDSPRRRPSTAFDQPRPRRQPAHVAEELDYLERVAKELRLLGESATVRQAFGAGVPYLRATGPEPDLQEDVTAIWKGEELHGRFEWGKDLPHDPAQAATAIRHVINPAVV